METITIVFAVAWIMTLGLLIRSLFRQAGIADAMKEATDQAHGQLKLWEEFGQHLDEGVALIDESESIVYANGAFTGMVQWPSRSSFNQPLDTVLDLQDPDAKPAPLPTATSDQTFYVLGKDGGRTTVHAARRQLHRPAGYSVVILQDATAETAEREIRDRLVKLSSFELRAPITAMKGYASMILEGDTGKVTPETKQYVQTILESTGTLLTIIDDMAHVDALSNDKLKVKQEHVSLKDYLASVIDDLSKTVQQAGRALEIKAVSLPAEIAVDRKQITRLLGMLANTAARTSKPNTVVELSAVESPGTVEIHLANQGDPLPKESQANVFDYAGGHGLDEGIGFYVAKQIIESHNAFVTVNTLEKGNVFVLSLPKLHKEEKPKPAETPDAEDKKAKTLHGDVKPR